MSNSPYCGFAANLKIEDGHGNPYFEDDLKKLKIQAISFKIIRNGLALPVIVDLTIDDEYINIDGSDIKISTVEGTTTLRINYGTENEDFSYSLKNSISGKTIKFNKDEVDFDEIVLILPVDDITGYSESIIEGDIAFTTDSSTFDLTWIQSDITLGIRER